MTCRPILVLLAILSAGCAQPDPHAPLEGLAMGWNRIAPGGDTICSNNTEYAFYVRPADPTRLMVHFQGGGACWFGENCDLTMSPTYDPTVDDSDDPGNLGGIFDVTNPDNPFAGFSMVYVPYCTGDVHIGNAAETYDVPATDSTQAHQVTIQHRGSVNARAVLEWTYEHFIAPAQLTINGSSAGAFPAAMYAAEIAEQYPEAAVTVLADGAGGYRSMGLNSMVEGWGARSALPDFPAFRALPDQELRLEGYLMASARHNPSIRLGQFNTSQDEVQRYFMALGGNPVSDLTAVIDSNRAEIVQADPDYRSYLAEGEWHTILGRPEFYSLEESGVQFRDWLARFAEGEPVEDVRCGVCGPRQTGAGE